jgi:hypothetical protein
VKYFPHPDEVRPPLAGDAKRKVAAAHIDDAAPEPKRSKFRTTLFMNTATSSFYVATIWFQAPPVRKTAKRSHMSSTRVLKMN